MAFVLELNTTFTQPHIKNYIVSIIREFGINAIVKTHSSKIVVAFDAQNSSLQSCLESIASRLPASCFLSGSEHYEVNGEPDSLPEYEISYPLGLGLCPACQKEMFDPSSRRYYYPFTSCSHCGGKYSFFTQFPYKREHTSFRFLIPCQECQDEMANVGIRENHYLNSCHKCGTAVRLMNKQNERYANDAGSFRTMFEVAAKALKDNKKLLVKTTFGYRVFYNLSRYEKDSVLMLINANRISSYVSLIDKEFNALLSIERPLLHVTLQDQLLKEKIGATSDVKYPDEGFSILLAKELQQLGQDYIFYKDVTKDTEADLLMDFDLEVTSQKDMKLFINKEINFIASGERVVFPSTMLPVTNSVSVAHGLVALPQEDAMLIDKMEHFESVHAAKVAVLEGENDTTYHSNQRIMAQDEASFMSVIAEHALFGQKCVGVHFEEEASFLYYDAKQVIRVVPVKKFEIENLLERISSLREGSDRLVINFKNKFADTYEQIEQLQSKSDATVFEAASVILGLKSQGFEAVSREALHFVGKGGMQIDMHVSDNRFDHVAFLASLISYRLAGVDSVLLSYSIFESFGDYFNDILTQIMGKTKAEHVVLCGTAFANQSLFSRMQRNLKLVPPFVNKNYPIGRENAVVGGIYL